ncbi:MAG TPA: OsmC family protein [Terrimicrobiaceae bacterium]
MNATTQNTQVNGIDVDALTQAIEAIAADPAQGQTRWQVSSRWRGGTRSDTSVKAYYIGSKRVAKDFTIRIDEPYELCGTNQFANPQEYLLASLNACMIVGYAAVCALQGIELEELRIETEGNIDLRGFLGLDSSVKPGYESLRYTVHIKGEATVEQFEKVHEIVKATSPNRFNVATAIALQSRLVVES